MCPRRSNGQNKNAAALLHPALMGAGRPPGRQRARPTPLQPAYGALRGGVLREDVREVAARHEPHKGISLSFNFLQYFSAYFFVKFKLKILCFFFSGIENRSVEIFS